MRCDRCHFKLKPLEEKFDLLLLLSTLKTTSSFQTTEASAAWIETVWNSCSVVNVPQKMKDTFMC